MKVLTIRITEEQYEFLREYAYLKRTTITDVFRKAIDNTKMPTSESKNIKKSQDTKNSTPYTEKEESLADLL